MKDPIICHKCQCYIEGYFNAKYYCMKLQKGMTREESLNKPDWCPPYANCCECEGYTCIHYNSCN